MSYKIQVRRSVRTRPWYWRVLARNGQVILTSETYASKKNAVRAAIRFLVAFDDAFVGMDIEVD